MGEAFKRQVKRIQESWFVVILGFLFEYWFEILITILSLILVKLLVDRLLSNFLDRIYKMCFNYDGTLAEMRKLLESDHGELWNTPEFCIAYLKMHDAYQTFLNAARTDASGKLRRDTAYEQYAAVNIAS
ncbi:hypothetical protein PRIPAC_74830 [Pristionchus pacificus]|uniref:Uncharacterized protein n=1 Tax=Pristionchus pacificus TaxID=54126 RepID=A0A454Y6G4_PRIPA|nr:hypothetical protein PRIPAC_74830 [Pristionchus pacificus]|eukprot:PDM64494.1 hypothetical protein PRIPAC_52750 [Pristionchus pacificus]